MGELDKRPRAGGRAVLSGSARKLGGRRDGGSAWTGNSHAGCSKVLVLTQQQGSVGGCDRERQVTVTPLSATEGSPENQHLTWYVW